MGLDITVTHDVRRLIDFASESRKQLPFATVLLLTQQQTLLRKPLIRVLIYLEVEQHLLQRGLLPLVRNLINVI